MTLAPRISPGPARRHRPRTRACPPVTAGVECPPLFQDQAFRICTAALLLLLVCLALPPVVSAQGFGPASASRRGLWFGAGAGQGFTDLRCGICDGEKETGGMTGYLRLGGTASERLLLGADVTHWRRKDGDILEHATGVAGAGYWYPDPRHGYYLKLGLGYSLYRAGEDDIALTARLLTAVTGIGYEMRVNPAVSLVPFVNVVLTAKGNMLREDTRNGGFTASRVADDLGLLSLQIGFGFTRH